MAKLCLPLGFVLAVMISADADNCLGGDCKAFGASSMRQSNASTVLSMLQSTAKMHYAEYVRSPANSSLVAKAKVACEISAGDSIYLQAATHGSEYVEVSGTAGGGYGVSTRATKIASAQFKIYKWSGESGQVGSGGSVYLQAATHGNQYVEVSGYAGGGYGVSTRATKGGAAQLKIQTWMQCQAPTTTTTPAPTPPTPSPTLDPTPSPTTTTTTTTTISLEGLDDDEQTIEVNDEQVDLHECRGWCYSKKHNDKPWTGTGGKCNWYACSTCPKCTAA